MHKPPKFNSEDTLYSVEEVNNLINESLSLERAFMVAMLVRLSEQSPITRELFLMLADEVYKRDKLFKSIDGDRLIFH